MTKPKIGDFFKVYWKGEPNKFIISKVIELHNNGFKLLRIYTNEKLWENSNLSTMNVPFKFISANTEVEPMSKDDVIMEML